MPPGSPLQQAVTEAVDERVRAAAERGYHAYGRSTDFKNFRGEPMPAWQDLPEKIRGAWCAAAQEILS